MDASQPRGIVWLASYPKSGNTWIRAFVHTLLVGLSGEKVDRLDLDAIAYFGESDRSVAYYRRYIPDEAISDRAAVAAVRPRLQSDIALGSPGPVMIKTHNALINYLGSPLINRAVSAGAVYVVRNPLDVAISFANFRSISIDEAIDVMATPQWSMETNGDDVYFVAGSWSEHVASWTARHDEAVLVVRYEDLLTHALPQFAAIAAHLRIPADAEAIQHEVDLTRFDSMQKAEAERGFLEKPPNVDRFFRSGRAGQWQDGLAASQVERIVSAHGDQMARFGYLPG
jgi:hypothetical protein